MALWQFDFYIIKKENAKLYDESKSWESGENEDLLNWSRDEIKFESINNISKVLLPSKSWSSRTEQFGNIDEYCLEISTYSDDCCQISFRLDLRKWDETIVFEILKFIKQHYAYIVYENRCYEIDEQKLNDLVNNSKAKKFCDNPYGFLSNIKKDFAN